MVFVGDVRDFVVMGKKYSEVLIVGLFLASCVPADMIVRVHGKIVDERKKPYESCMLSLKRDDKLLDIIKIGGEFHDQFIVGVYPFGKLYLVIRCEGSQRQRKLEIKKLPKIFSEYINFGTVVLERSG